MANFANRGYNDYRLTLPRTGTWRVRFNSDWNGYSADFSNWFSAGTSNGTIGIGPYRVVILSQD